MSNKSHDHKHGPGGRPRRRKKPVLSLYGRVARLAVIAVLSAVALYGIVTKIVQPFGMGHQQSQQASALKAQLQTTSAQNATLERQVAYLHTPEGEMAAARAQGFLKPGEMNLVIEPPAVPQAPPPPDGLGTRLKHALQHLMRH